MSRNHLRFEKFNEIDWQTKRVNQILNKVVNPVKVEQDTLYKQIGIRSHGKGIFHKELVSGKEIGNKRIFWLEKNLFIVNIVFAWERAVARTTENETGLVASHRFPMYRPIEKEADLDYLLHFFLTKRGNQLLELASPGGAGRNKTLGQKEFEKLAFSIPSLSEQQKIAAYLSSIDQNISLLTEKKKELSRYKKGMMQKLFAQQIRFKDENGNDFTDWEEKRLSEISKFRRGSFPQPYGLAKWYDDKNGFPFVQVYDVGDDFKLKKETKRKISYLATKLSVFVPTGTILVTIQGSIGRIAITNIDCYVDRTLLIITSLAENLEVNYYKYCLFLLFEIEKHKAPGGTIKTITKEVLSDFTIPFPSLPEQIKIADFLSAIDESIDKVNEQIKQTQGFKKAMLQQMFV
ncbi:restriction endonuclease subunit S [Pedobacter sp. Leaf194]|uniref:restriction endonuclease subunit S n=1 Tax=Pedobacter sp. Leaf194 TaxID=1736297 RepID=UPI00070337BC|nr:restriction endonuclease subunit S [Pedobacter sp. Leaf194]KQS41824.1 hypothetical protein ASG14_05095 [Pedobacter sp. Leaf194]